MAKLDKVPDGSDQFSGVFKNWLSRLQIMVNKIDTDNDIICETPTKGIVLRSPNLHYWRATISNAGVVTWTDLGLTRP